MKYYIASLLSILVLTAVAQQSDIQIIPEVQPKPYSLFKDTFNKNVFRSKVDDNFIAFTIPDARLIRQLPNGTKVYALPLDNMPCLVPGMKQFNMPVIMPPATGNMPNAAVAKKVHIQHWEIKSESPGTN